MAYLQKKFSFYFPPNFAWRLWPGFPLDGHKYHSCYFKYSCHFMYRYHSRLRSDRGCPPKLLPFLIAAEQKLLMACKLDFSLIK
jgi:hypothetical protein